MLLPCALTLIVYSNTLESPFTFDDVSRIRDNLNIRLTELDFDAIKTAADSNRPVAYLSFALNYYFDRYDLFGYHLVNILIHIATGLLLYSFSRTTLSIVSPGAGNETRRWTAFFAAFLWLVHPINTQSVTYIVQRMNSMSAMFYLLSVLMYARGRLSVKKVQKRALLAGCAFAGILAVGSKEIAATLPLFILLYEWYFFQDLSMAWLKRLLFPIAVVSIMLVITATVYLLGTNVIEGVWSQYEQYDFNLMERLLTESRVVIYYIGLLIFPYYRRLNLDYDFPISRSLFEPATTLPSILGIALLMWLAIRIARKQRLISFCILWFFGNLAIESSVIPIEIIYEHRTYLPATLVSLLTVILAYRLIKQQRLVVVILCAIAAIFSLWTFQRNNLWADDLALWSDAVHKSPGKARPHNNLGLALADRGRLEEAVKHYAEAVKIRPIYVEAHNNLGVALRRLGRLEEAAGHFQEALHLNSGFAEAQNNLGTTLTAMGRFEEAVEHCSEALRLKPGFAKIHGALAGALSGLGRYEEAIDHLYQALKIEPDFADVHHDLGLALQKVGREKEANYHLSEALRIRPGLDEAHHDLGLALAKQGRLDEAINHFREALRTSPGSAQAHYNLGLALSLTGKPKEAMEHLAEAIRIKPEIAEAHYNLGALMAAQGRQKEAVYHFSEALRIRPDFSVAEQALKHTEK